MKQTTKDAARKAISFFQGEVDPQRLTGGSLPGRSGLVVAIRSAHTVAPPHANGNGSPDGVHATREKATGSPLEALLVVADQGADEVSIMKEVASGEAIGPAGDLVGEKTKSRILSWKAAETDENGAMSDRYILSVAASLIDHPLSELLADGNAVSSEPEAAVSEASEPEAGDIPEGTTGGEGVAQESPDEESPAGGSLKEEEPHRQAHSEKDPTEEISTEGIPGDGVHGKEAINGQADDDSQVRPGTPHEQVPWRFSMDKVHTFPAEVVHTTPRQSDPASGLEGESGQEPETNITLGPGTDLDQEPGSGDSGPEHTQEPEINRKEIVEEGRMAREDGAHDLPGAEYPSGPLREASVMRAPERAVRKPPFSAEERAGVTPSHQDANPENPQPAHPGPESPPQDSSPGAGADAIRQETENNTDHHEREVGRDTEQQIKQQKKPDNRVDPEAGTTNIPATPANVEADAYPNNVDGHGWLRERPHRGPENESPRAAVREPQPHPVPEPAETGEPAGYERGQPAEGEENDEEPEWASELASGKTHTPEQRAYLIDKESSKKRSLKFLRRKHEPDPPAGLSNVQNLQDEVIKVLATAPEGPGIVTPLISKGGTGKTSVAVELAFTFARMMGSNGDSRHTGRVLLVDQNLTNPDLANRVAVEGAGRKGVKDLLEGDELHRVVARTALPNLDALFLLGKGDRDLETVQAALSNGRTMEAVIDTLATGTGQYDIIVVDTANTLPAQKDNPASYAMTMWASIADARYLVLQPETASFKNATWFASAMGDALSEGQYLTAVMNCFPQKRVYEEAPITAELARKRKAALGALQRLEQSEHYPVGPAISARGRPLETPLIVPDYPEEVRGFAAEGRPISMFSQTFADAYKRIAMDAIRRMLVTRMTLK